ncbi:MAG: Na+/H+ antiporter NhaC family protein [Myxococcota bacterium]
MARRLTSVGIGIGVLVAVGLLNLVSLDAEFLHANQVRSDWWWSGSLLSPLAGSVLPPLVGIALVMATRRLLPSLLAGVGVAALLYAGPWPHTAVWALVARYLWGAVWDPFHASILIFTATLIGLVGVATRSGGTQGIVELVLRYAKGVRGTQVATVLMGFAIFFDDYANTAIVGPTVRPLTDRLKISREKLSYLIDSTAAPVAGLAIVSTWVGTEVGYLQDAAQSVGVTTSGYALFLSALSFRFYCVFALFLVFLVALTGRDFGPMLKAEQRARSTGQVIRPGSQPLSGKGTQAQPKLDKPARAMNALVPIGTVLALIVGAVYVLGAPEGSGLLGIFNPSVWRDSFITASDLADGNALSYVFACSAVVGAAVAILMPWPQGILTPKEGVVAWAAGAKTMVIAFGILILAWALSQACKDLQTAPYVAAALQGRVSAEMVPLVVFVVSGMVAFATGTSWGTMAILIPMAAPIAYHTGGEAMMIVAMAAVLDGSIFGDHCSPISDTTVLSSICSGSDHLDHVRTQAPYALLGATIAALCGYGLVAAVGAPTWAGYLTGFALLSLIVWSFGRVASATEPSRDASGQ